MLDILRRACEQLLADSDFWLLAALTDRSFEEGERNRVFRESVDWYEKAGLPQQLAARLRCGINRNLVDIIGHFKDRPPNIEYNPTRNGLRPDICFGDALAGTATTIEVKAIFDLTMPKWYPIVAADSDKLKALRQPDFSGRLLQAVFFIQLPGFDYPPGRWYGQKSGACLPRGQYPGYRGIAAQYEMLRRYLTDPAWSDVGPYTVNLKMPGTELLKIIARWFELIFRPAGGWRFDPAQHLAGAAAGCAIWEH